MNQTTSVEITGELIGSTRSTNGHGYRKTMTKLGNGNFLATVRTTTRTDEGDVVAIANQVLIDGRTQRQFTRMGVDLEAMFAAAPGSEPTPKVPVSGKGRLVRVADGNRLIDAIALSLATTPELERSAAACTLQGRLVNPPQVIFTGAKRIQTLKDDIARYTQELRSRGAMVQVEVAGRMRTIPEVLAELREEIKRVALCSEPIVFLNIEGAEAHHRGAHELAHWRTIVLQGPALRQLSGAGISRITADELAARLPVGAHIWVRGALSWRRRDHFGKELFEAQLQTQVVSLEPVAEMAATAA